MVSITKSEKDKILKVFPRTRIIRASKQNSKRHHYMMEENPLIKDYLEQLRKENIISENGVEVSYPAAKAPVRSHNKRPKFDSNRKRKTNQNKDSKKKEYSNRRDDFKPKNGWKTQGDWNSKNDWHTKGHNRWENKSQYKDKPSKKDSWD